MPLLQLVHPPLPTESSVVRVQLVVHDALHDIPTNEAQQVLVARGDSIHHGATPERAGGSSAGTSGTRARRRARTSTGFLIK